MFKKKQSSDHQRKTITIEEKQELRCMRAQIVNLEAMLMQGIISRQDYQKELGDINSRITALEVKYGLR
ncbi:MAG: hypothetical protein IKE94_02525 [Aeriscardovia sp.]|nr:hypothetical protein [Aeriscardovia sp.]